MTSRETYESEFYEWHRDGCRKSAAVVVPLLIDLLEPASVVDIGCGTGEWLAEFQRRGVEEILGIDGDHLDRRRLGISTESFRAHDLARPLRLSRSFDLALSLEVAEHIPADHAEPFIDSLTSLASVVVFSAAIPHQGGDGHVNEQWPEWWAERFRDRGYLPIDCLRRRLWRDERVSWWYAQNMLVYASPLALEATPRLAEECQRAESADPLPLVHPKRYLEWVEWAMRELYGNA